MSTVFFLAMTLVAAEPTASSPVVLPQAEQFELKSASGEAYRIFVYKPAAPAPEGGYPVMYFTDANTGFPLAVSLSKTFDRVTGPVVLVGIGYPTDDRAEITKRRTYDLTPETPSETIARFQETRRAASERERPGGTRPPPAAPADLKTGGNEAFFRFIEKDLKPVIQQRAQIDRGRQAFFGHSYGGLFALHGLLAHPEAFQTYIVASPSLWLNPATMKAEEEAFGKRVSQLQAKPRVLITLGGEEPKHLGKADGETAKSSAAEELAARLKGLGLDASYHEFAGENHGSVVAFAMSRGLRFAFEKGK